LKDWYHSNGNYRAWPYSLNRSDHDDAPLVKLNPESEDDIKWWSNYLKNNKLTKRKLKDYLLKVSFCDKEWLEFESDDIKKKIKENYTAKQIIYYILNRNRNICIEWYERLKIDSLIPESLPKKKKLKELFENIIINKWKWEKEGDEYVYNLSIGDKNLSLYFSFDVEGDTLKEDGIEFGLMDNKGGTLKNIKIDKGFEDRYYFEKYNGNDFICYWFTLFSFSDNSIIRLFKEFNKWLREFPDKQIKDSVIEKFCNSIKSKYENKVMDTN